MENKTTSAIIEAMNRQQTYILCKKVKSLLSDIIIDAGGINDIDIEELRKARALIERLQDEAFKATMLASLKEKYNL